MSKDKELSVDPSLREELEIKKKKLEDLFKILDYNELDVARFLNILIFFNFIFCNITIHCPN